MRVPGGLRRRHHAGLAAAEAQRPRPRREGSTLIQSESPAPKNITTRHAQGVPVGFAAETVRKPPVRTPRLDDAWRNQRSREQLFSGKTLMQHTIFSNGCSYDSLPVRHSFGESLGAWPSYRSPHTSLWRGALFVETAGS